MNVSTNPLEVRPVKGELNLINSHPLVIDDGWLGGLDPGMLAGVTKMDLRGTTVTATGLAKLLERATALQELNLENLQLGNEVLGPIAGSPVRKLNLGGTHIDSKGLLTFASPVLESLAIDKTRVGDEGLRNLGKNLPALRTLNLGYLHGYTVGLLTDKGIEPLVDVAALQNLYLNKTKITGKALKTISRLQLLVLSLGKTQIPDADFRHLRCPRLEVLHIDFTTIPDLQNRGFSDVGLGNLDLPTLQRLDVSRSFYTIVGTGIPTLRLPALRSLDLSQTEVAGQGLDASNLPNLIKLQLQQTKISDEGLVHINAPALQELDLSWNDEAITDAGLDRLLQPRFGREVLFPALQRLDLRYTHTTKEGIARLKARYPDLTVQTYCK